MKSQVLCVYRNDGIFFLAMLIRRIGSRYWCVNNKYKINAVVVVVVVDTRLCLHWIFACVCVGTQWQPKWKRCISCLYNLSSFILFLIWLQLTFAWFHFFRLISPRCECWYFKRAVNFSRIYDVVSLILKYCKSLQTHSSSRSCARHNFSLCHAYNSPGDEFTDFSIYWFRVAYSLEVASDLMDWKVCCALSSADSL